MTRNIYGTLNNCQLEAVENTEGPLLVLAGAGSGKTRALTHRIAYMIEEKGVSPWNILAITFTNKAAREMKERVQALIPEGNSVWVSTFHSTCVRILRTGADRLGFTRDFTIYDTDDQRSLMKQIIKQKELDPKMYRERAILSRISSMKNEMITPESFSRSSMGNYRDTKIADLYAAYQDRMQSNNAMDFDDLLMKTVQLFEQNPDILENYRHRFRYILVDEYQDTNTAQFRMVELLARNHKNLCVVGDDDQSIYKFRGANIQNILNFENYFPGAKVIRLEQNYRSTKNILETANQVIRNNTERKAKKLWTDNPEGKKVKFWKFDTAYDEAEAIVKDVEAGRDRFPYGSCAVLYRTNAQSRLLEERCISHNIPYRMVGGVNFYQRKEIKDILCYLKTIANGCDDLAVQRIINVPARGIGLTSIDRISDYARINGMGFYDALTEAAQAPALKRASSKIDHFVGMIEALKKKAEFMTIEELIDQIMEDTGYRQDIENSEPVEAASRMENINELKSKAADFGDEPGDAGALSRFLEEVALVAEVDAVDSGEDRLILMTLHSSKGLEFPKVYMCGMEDGLFPSSIAIGSSDESDLQEERRLCYVGITRAREELVLTAARMRMINGENQYHVISRFVEEIPKELLEEKGRGLMDTAGSDMERRLKKGEYTANQKSEENWKPSPFWQTGASMGKVFEIKKEQGLEYGKGDRVRHVKFGDGTVLEVQEGKRDFEVTVAFDRGGNKKLFASFAKLQKI